MCQLVETIKICHRKAINLDYHNQRMNRSRQILFQQKNKINLADYIEIPKHVDDSIYKCKVIYNNHVEFVEFLPYTMREIKTLKLVENSAISYEHKYLNRHQIEELYGQRGDCDDILIIKNAMFTDTSFCNIALFDGKTWFTPESPLLKGTKRQRLLDEKIIFSKEISFEDLMDYKKLCLFNAMIDFGEMVIPIKNIRQ